GSRGGQRSACYRAPVQNPRNYTTALLACEPSGSHRSNNPQGPPRVRTSAQQFQGESWNRSEGTGVDTGSPDCTVYFSLRWHGELNRGMGGYVCGPGNRVAGKCVASGAVRFLGRPDGGQRISSADSKPD